jgi:hypothetical protein
MRRRITRSRIARCSLGLGAAALWNPWTGDWLLGSAPLEEPALRAALLALGLLSLAWALLALLGPAGRATAVLQTVLFVSLVCTPLATEVFFRVAIATDSFGLAAPRLYAGHLSDDDYYKLRETWQPTAPSRNLHPLLGWAPRPDRRNPLGIHRESGYEPRRDDVVLCFGDSFMASLTPFPHKIPDVIDRTLPQWTAYNYGVGGYGVDQIYLRFREAHPQFVDPIVVVGIMYSDLDRSLLSVRDRPKPHFRLRGDELVLEGTPLPADQALWYAAHPPTLRSFFFAWCVQRWRYQGSGRRVILSNYRREESCRLNRAILEALVAEARAHELRLVFATFPDGTSPVTWRDEFLEGLFAEQDVPWVDGRAVLVEAAREEGTRLERYFGAQYHGHPNIRGNQHLGEAIAACVLELWG